MLKLTDEPYLGWIIHIKLREKVFIPFVCRKCGKCCREVSVDPNQFAFASRAFPTIRKIAYFLKLPCEEVIRTYFGEIMSTDDKRISYKQTIPMKPCAFLEGNECKIYSIRPIPCRLFPVFREDGEVFECPMKLRFTELRKTIVRSFKDSYLCTTKYYETSPPEVHIEARNWKKILRKYISLNPGKEDTELFIRFNKPK